MIDECPNGCESTTFVQTVEQTETVHLNEAGTPEWFEKHEQGPTLEKECAECGAEVES